MRSFKEIRFRLRQEAANAWLWLRRPSLPQRTAAPTNAITVLPLPEGVAARLRGSQFAQQIETLAESICEHRFPLLGYVVDTGSEIRWRRDYISGIESGIRWFRRIPYLDASRAGDHKIIWELNRHQHLVLLAQAWRLTGNTKFLDEISTQLESWWEQNPFLRGINWASALEVAFRALSWIWVYHLSGTSLPDAIRRRLLAELYRHGLHLERNLSVYFSPNTHLLGEAVALHALGKSFPTWPRSRAWIKLGGRIVAEEMNNQVRADGSHFEQSSAYHVYATDFFLLHAVFADVDDGYRMKLRRMADYLAALSSADGVIPLMGDDDGGNIFHPFGNRRRFAAASLAACSVFFEEDGWPYTPADKAPLAAWWFGERAFHPRPPIASPLPCPALFSDAGVAVLSRNPAHIIVDTRAFGHANAGHSHAHALAVVCRHGDRDILMDPGTYTYVAEPMWRARFRGTAFHNTVRVDGLDQADGAGPFRWANKPQTSIPGWRADPGFTHLRATCSFRGIVHERQVLWIHDVRLLAVMDVVRTATEDANTHVVEQFWHPGDLVTRVGSGIWSIGASAALSVPAASIARVITGEELGWQSDAPGLKVARPVIVVEQRSRLPIRMAALLSLDNPLGYSLAIDARKDRTRISESIDRFIDFSDGTPVFQWKV